MHANSRLEFKVGSPLLQPFLRAAGALPAGTDRLRGAAGDGFAPAARDRDLIRRAPLFLAHVREEDRAAASAVARER